MSTLISVAVATIALVSLRPAGPQPAGTTLVEVQPAPAAAAWNPYPIDVQLATVVDDPSGLANQLVRLGAVRIERVVGANVVELMDARERGPYTFHIYYRPDRLLAVLPAGTHVSPGDVIAVEGTLKTVRDATMVHEISGAGAGQLKKEGNRPVLVATSATTLEGVSLAHGE